jgi:rubrerythrin
MELGEPDERGRRKPVGTGEQFEVACDTVIVALGTNPNPIVTRNTKGLELDSRGYVAADPVSQATNLPGVFAGGDIVTGGATVILAMGAGRRAASAILQYLTDGTQAPVEAATGSVCPRCHRPVEPGDEDGICCADQVVAWKCSSCSKRSEGFAFPYGRCPACSGQLVPVDATTATVPDEAMDAVRKAFEIELGGRDFYVAAAKHTSDEELHDMFQRLAEMEREHIDTLVRRYHLPPPDDATGDLHPGALQAGAQRPPSDPLDLLELALTLEQRAEEFFRTRVDEASPAARELYRELAAEEGEHIALLTTELSALRNNRRGIL